MATAPRQHLPPCCHGVLLPRKDTPRVRFKSELTKYAVPSAKKDALPRLAAALTDARSALQLDRSASDASGSGSKFETMEQIQAYLAALAEYLSLVKGFTVTAASLVSDTQPPMVGGESVVNPVATLDASGLNGSPQAALRQPLIDTAATGVDLTASRSKCLSFCSWRDVLTTSNIHAPNARIEMAQTLLASGLHLMNDARVRVDAMLAERVTEIPENELKIAYQLLLHAAGVLDACLRSIDCVPRAIGADVSDLSGNAGDATTTDKAQDDEAELAKWREEQQRTNHTLTAPPLASDPLLASDAARANTNEDDLAMLNRLPDLAGGRFPQVLAWVALAQAQELVILRGISRDFVDYSLMAKLSLDVAMRYSEVHAFTRRYLPCMSSALAERLQLYAAFKHAYYTAVSCYFQGAACMEKDDARHCAQAIADFKQAAKLIQQANNFKTQYDAKTGKDKDDRDRLFAIKTVYVRAEQIIQRDLEIVTRRNDSIYYERIPEPEPPCEPISLVRAVEFAAVEVHALWHDADINSCVQATPPRAATSAAQANGAAGSSRPADATAGNTQEAAKPRDGCCGSCVIS